MKGWQVWSCASQLRSTPIPERLLFGGKVFPTRKAAEEAWYDTAPGCNDHACYRRVK